MAITTDPNTGLPVDDFAGEETPGETPAGDTDANSQPGAFSPEDTALLSALSRVPHPSDSLSLDDPAILRRPDDRAPPSTPEAAPQETKTGAKLSVAQSGITPAGTKKAAGIFGTVEAANDPERQRLLDEATANKAAQDKHYAEAHAAIIQEAADAKRHYEELSSISRDEITHARTEAETEALAQAKAHAEGAQYIDNYKQQMAGVRQLMTQTGNPLGGLDTTGKLGLAAAAFAQGFLGARGVKVDVTGQIDRWVEREIASHQQKIGNLKNAAEGELTLYGIARQGAQDDWEARQRLRGFVIDGLKSRAMLEASRWASSAANTAAMAKAAELDMHQDANSMVMQNKFTEQKQNLYREETTRAAEIGRLSLENRKLSLEEDNNRRLWAKDAKTEPAKEESHIYLTDPTNVKRDWLGKIISGGKKIAEIDPNAPPGIKTQASDVVGKASRFYSEMAPNLDKLETLFVKAKPGMKGPEWLRKKGSQEYKNYNQLKTYLTERLQTDITGAAAPDEQANRIADWLAADNWSDSGTNEAFISELKNILRNKYEAAIKGTPGIIVLNKNALPEGQQYAEPLTIDEPTKTLSDVRLRADEPVPPGLAEKVYSGAIDADAGDTHKWVQSGMLRNYLEQMPNEGHASDKIRLNESNGLWARNDELAIDDLARIILSPDTYGAVADNWGLPSGKESADEMKNEASLALLKLAKDHDYADHVRQMIENNPESAKKLLERPKE